MTTIDTFANFATSTLASSISSGATSLSVSAGTGSKYPSSGPFMLLLGTTSGAYELVKCTARSGDTFTVVRGQEGTTATSWTAGSTPVTQVVTAANMANLWAASPQVYNVLAYGAVGDGVHNDTSAIQAAITAVPSNGGIVYFPPGEYLVTDKITVKNGLVLAGSGDATSTILQTGANKDGLYGVDIESVCVRDLYLYGTGAGTGKGINFTHSVNAAVPYISLQNVNVASFGSDGIFMSNPIVSVFDRVLTTTNGGYGFNVTGANPSGAAGTSISFLSCYANGNTTGGYRLYNMTYCALHACACDSTPIAYLVDNCQGVSLNGCGGEAVTTNTFKINASFGIVLAGCWVYDGSGNQIYITGSSTAISLISCMENSPHAGVLSFIKTDSGSYVTLISCKSTTANSLASGTSSILDDGAGNTTIKSSLTLNGPSYLSTTTFYGPVTTTDALNLKQSASAASLTTGGSIATANISISRVTTSGAVTGVILASGTVSGQIVTVVNESANSITFAVSGTSHVADGTSDIIAANTARSFVWTGSLWYACK
jgi:hypothetical protein